MEQRAQRGSDRVDNEGKLNAGDKPEEATGLNVDGKEPTGPDQGFGQLWRKTYRVSLKAVTVSPEELVDTWKKRLPEFMPEHSRFYPTLQGIHAGQVVYIDAKMPPAVPVSTGVLVLETSDTYFTLVTPQGHPESGYNTFSAFSDDSVMTAQIQSLARSADPFYEFGYRFMGGMQHQESIWRHVLTSLARHLGVKHPEMQIRRELLDRHLQWSNAGHVWHNAMIRTTLQTPVRLFEKVRGKVE